MGYLVEDVQEADKGTDLDVMLRIGVGSRTQRPEETLEHRAEGRGTAEDMKVNMNTGHLQKICREETANKWHSYILSAVCWLIPQRGICPRNLLCLLRPTLTCTTCGTNQIVLWCGLRLASVCIVFHAFWEGLLHKPILAFPVTFLGPLGRGCKALCSWRLPVLDLVACVGGLTVN